MAAPPLLEVAGATFRYPESPNGVTGVTLAVAPGERVLVLGRNGSGKSTLLQLCAGRRMAQAGRVAVDGRDAFDDTSLKAGVSLIGAPWPPEAYFGSPVERVARPAPDEERRREVARGLHLRLAAPVDRMSAGEKRRVQILHGLLRPPRLLLLDECSTEVDVAERQTVLRIAAAECAARGAACLYATHILDGVAGWATRVVLMEGGRLVRDEPYSAALAADRHLAHAWLSRRPFVPFAPPPAYPHAAAAAAPRSAALNAAQCEGLTFRGVFAAAAFAVPRGSRTLLVGCNGSGKSTVLNLLAGKQFFPNEPTPPPAGPDAPGAALRVHGRRCYHDVALNHEVAFCGNWWPRAPPGQMTVGELLPFPLTAEAEEVRAVLDVGADWDLRHISAGELKRVQLLLALHRPRPTYLLDEATADLDLDMRHALLRYLAGRSELHGATVVYTTHIFEGLDGWATDCVVLDSTARGAHVHLRGDEVDLEAVVRTLHQLKAGEHFEP